MCCDFINCEKCFSCLRTDQYKCFSLYRPSCYIQMVLDENLSVCAIDFTDKASTTRLPEILVCQSSLDTHSQHLMCAMSVCVSACSRGIWSEFVICDIFPLRLWRQKKLCYCTAEWPKLSRYSRFQALLISYLQYWQCWFHSTLNSDSEYQGWYHSDIHWQWILTHLSSFCPRAGQTVT